MRLYITVAYSVHLRSLNAFHFHFITLPPTLSFFSHLFPSTTPAPPGAYSLHFTRSQNIKNFQNGRLELKEGTALYKERERDEGGVRGVEMNFAYCKGRKV